MNLNNNKDLFVYLKGRNLFLQYIKPFLRWGISRNEFLRAHLRQERNNCEITIATSMLLNINLFLALLLMLTYMAYIIL